MMTLPFSGQSSWEAHLFIATLNFAITCKDFPVVQTEEEAYGQFHLPASVQAVRTVPVTLRAREQMPDFGKFDKIFATGQSWTLHGDADCRIFTHAQPDRQNGLNWLTRIGPGRTVEVFCGPDLISRQAGVPVVVSPVNYPLDQLLLIYLLLGKGLIIHGAGMVIDGKGYLFAGPSGAGKSTISALFQDCSNVTILSDDRIVVEKLDHEFRMFGTPWPGDAGIAVNDCAALHGIFFLKHGDRNRIKELSIKDALADLFKVSSLPWFDRRDLQQALDLCGDLLRNIKTYELDFRPRPEIVAEIMSFFSG